MPLAVIKTNMRLQSIPDSFCTEFENYICQHVGCDPSLTMIEVHAGLLMSRNGNTGPMINMEFHHNEENIHSLTKKDFAAKFAGFLVQYLQVPVERVLILFMDTRCTTLESTAL